METVHAHLGLIVTRTQLEALGVAAAPEEAVPAPRTGKPHRLASRNWPSYVRCLENAPWREGGRRERSRADFTFCLLALDWGWGMEEIAARLMQVSGKTKESGEAYAVCTVRAAAAAIARREGRQR